MASMIRTSRDGTPTQASELIRTFRFQAPQICQILDELDEASRPASGEVPTHFSFRTAAALQITGGPCTGGSAYLIAPRRISANEFAFLFGGFIHPGMRISVRLTTLYGAMTDHPGTVSECRHIEANIHEVKMVFEHPLDPARFTAHATPARVLVAEDEALFRLLAKQLLHELNAHVDYATNGYDAVRKATSNIYDIIFMDIAMPQQDGLDAARALRSAGYPGRIVAITGLTRPEDHARCIEAGFDGYIPKPFNRHDLAEAIGAVSVEPIYSEFEHVLSMREIIIMFIRELPERIRTIREAVAGHDGKRAEAALRSLKSIAGSCGFVGLSQAAAAIELQLIEGAAVDSVGGPVRELLDACMRARTSVIDVPRGWPDANATQPEHAPRDNG